MKKMTAKRAAIHRKMLATYAQIDEERGCWCEVCGVSSKEHSHNFPKEFQDFIADPENITIMCREHHLAWENSRLWLMTPDILVRVVRFLQANDNHPQFDELTAAFKRKLFKCVDRLKEDKILNIPDWLTNLLHIWKIPIDNGLWGL